jgi:hypothetical protein
VKTDLLHGDAGDDEDADFHEAQCREEKAAA